MKKKALVILVVLVMVATLFGGCMRQANKVSNNLSQEADNFNVTRKLSIINQRTDTILFQMTGNFSVLKSSGDLDIVGENDDGTYYKHFVYLSDEISYVVEDLGRTSVNKHRYEINFNPDMIIPFDGVIID